MNQEIRGKTYDEERALYNIKDTSVINCTFAGPADGESVLKECHNVTVENCKFSLRYPLWHAHGFHMLNSDMDDKTRAPIWYAENGLLSNSRIYGVKCLRECQNIQIKDCKISSPEFGWKCQNVSIDNSEIESEYFLFESRDIKINQLNMRGKYSFQYIHNLHIQNSVLNTKDAFWHSQNVTVEDSIVNGEYLGWFSDGLTLINCKISGTQPLCYCKNLRLINCTMENTDLSFEYSDVEAEIIGHIDSVKNPHSGNIVADSIGEIILEDSIMESRCNIQQRNAT